MKKKSELMKMLKIPAITAAIGFILAGCASVASDPENTTAFDTDPSGAVCVIDNDQGFRKEITTPASLTMHRDLAPVWISCSAPKHSSVREKLAMSPNGWILGNILIGGLIGIAVDAASGANQKFPDRISILLEPSEFQTIEERDAWFEKRKANLEQEFAAQAEKIEGEYSRCQDTFDSCLKRLEKLEEDRVEEFAKLERLRRQATVRTSSTIVRIGGQNRCLIQTAPEAWRAGTCPDNLRLPQATPAPAPRPEPKTAKIVVEGKQQCLSELKPGLWEATPCKVKKKTANITVDGRKQCLVEIEKGLWKSRPC